LHTVDHDKTRVVVGDCPGSLHGVHEQNCMLWGPSVVQGVMRRTYVCVLRLKALCTVSKQLVTHTQWRSSNTTGTFKLCPRLSLWSSRSGTVEMRAGKLTSGTRSWSASSIMCTPCVSACHDSHERMHFEKSPAPK